MNIEIPRYILNIFLCLFHISNSTLKTSKEGTIVQIICNCWISTRGAIKLHPFGTSAEQSEKCMLDVLFRQVSTFLKDSTAFVYGLGGF